MKRWQSYGLGMMVLLGVRVGLLARFGRRGLYRRWLGMRMHWHGFSQQKLALTEQGTLSYYIAGEGPAVMLVHGFGGDGVLTWQYQMAALARKYQVIVPDLLWFGESGAACAPTLAAQADALQALLAHLDIRRVALVGVSYGGFVVQELSARYPARVSKLIIVDSPGSDYAMQDTEELLERTGAASLPDLFVPDSGDKVKRLIYYSMSKEVPLPDSLYDELYQMGYADRQVQLTALINELSDNRGAYHQRLQSTDGLPRPELIWGAEDLIFPLALGQRFAAEQGVTLQVIPAAGHAAPVTSPRAVLRLLRRHLTGID